MGNKLVSQSYPSLSWTEYLYLSTIPQYSDVEVEINDSPVVDHLQKVLLNMLNYTYNYYHNFEGAENNPDGTPKNEMIKLKQKFERQKPEDVITNLWKQWELNNPNYVNHQQAKNFKKINIMLSKYILSKMSINSGLNDDNKLLLPYYFDLVSKPIFNSENDRKDWQFKDCKVILKSKYFDFSNYPNIKIKNNDLSQNALFQLDENQFNWLSIRKELESNAIPSLLPLDWKLSDGELGKYFTNYIIKKTILKIYLIYTETKNLIYIQN